MHWFVLQGKKTLFTCKSKSLILFLHISSANIGLKPMRISLSRSISSSVWRIEPDHGIWANTEDRTEGLRNSLCNSQQSRRERKPDNDSTSSQWKQARKWLALRPLYGSLPSSLSRGNILKDKPLPLWLFSFVTVVLPRGTCPLNCVNTIH